MRLVLLVALLACSSPSHAPGPVPPTAPPRDAGAVVQTAPGCPASFAQVAGPCTSKQACSYPEGTCTCAAPPWCGGAMPPPDYYEHTSWQCTRLVGADGCPGATPREGDACSREGQTCDYTCSCSLTARCTGGKWDVQNGPCKP